MVCTWWSVRVQKMKWKVKLLTAKYNYQLPLPQHWFIFMWPCSPRVISLHDSGQGVATWNLALSLLHAYISLTLAFLVSPSPLLPPSPLRLQNLSSLWRSRLEHTVPNCLMLWEAHTSLVSHVTITWSSHDCHMTVTWPFTTRYLNWKGVSRHCFTPPRSCIHVLSGHLLYIRMSCKFVMSSTLSNLSPW